MTFKMSKCFGTAAGMGMLATLAMPQAWGELVYESAQPAAPAAPTASTTTTITTTVQDRSQDRTTMRQAIGASEKMQTTLQAQSPTPVVAETEPFMAAAPIAAAAVETETVSKAELMRRERQRQELRNEDLLQERLEELRLRDERRRTEEVLAAHALPTAVAVGATAGTGSVAPTSAPSATQSIAVQQSQISPAPAMKDTPGATGMQEEFVGSGVDQSQVPAMAPAVAVGGVSQSMVVSTPSDSEKMLFSISPRVGISNLTGNGGYFDIKPHFAAGAALRVSTSDNISFEVGYTYNEYGVAMATNNPFILMRQQQATMYGYPNSFNLETVTMKQNIFDAGLKIHLLGVDSRVRPFVGGGGSYSRGYVNFSHQVLADMNRVYGRNSSPDFVISNFMGYLSTGLDVKVAKNISVGAEFKYYAVLSATESDNFSSYYGAFYQPYGGYNLNPNYYGVNPALNQDTAVAGGSISRSSLYTILGTVTFTF